jgi:hypothetical protein
MCWCEPCHGYLTWNLASLLHNPAQFIESAPCVRSEESPRDSAYARDYLLLNISTLDSAQRWQTRILHITTMRATNGIFSNSNSKLSSTSSSKSNSSSINNSRYTNSRHGLARNLPTRIITKLDLREDLPHTKHRSIIRRRRIPQCRFKAIISRNSSQCTDPLSLRLHHLLPDLIHYHQLVTTHPSRMGTHLNSRNSNSRSANLNRRSNIHSSRCTYRGTSHPWPRLHKQADDPFRPQARAPDLQVNHKYHLLPRQLPNHIPNYPNSPNLINGPIRSHTHRIRSPSRHSIVMYPQAIVLNPCHYHSPCLRAHQ